MNDSKNSSNSTNNIIISTEDDFEIYLMVSKYLWILISPLIFILGVLGGILTLLVLRKLKYWKERNIALIPIVFLTVTDMTVLCVGISRYWVIETMEYDLRVISDFGCKLNMFVIYTSMQYSSWTLVCMTFERFFKAFFTFKYLGHVTRTKIVVVLVLVLFLLAAINSHFFWTHTVIVFDDIRLCSVLDSFQTFDNWYTKIDLALLSIIPFILMTVFNILIYIALRRAHTWRRESIPSQQTRSRITTSDRRITIMMLVTSIVFIITTLPISVIFLINSYSSIESVDPVQVARTKLVGTIAYLLQYSNYAVNFLFYTVTNVRFRRKLHIICCCSTTRYQRRNGQSYNLRSTSESVTSLSSSFRLTESFMSTEQNPSFHV